LFVVFFRGAYTWDNAPVGYMKKHKKNTKQRRKPVKATGANIRPQVSPALPEAPDPEVPLVQAIPIEASDDTQLIPVAPPPPIDGSTRRRMLLLGFSVLLAALALVWLVGNIFFGKLMIGSAVVSGLHSDITLLQVVHNQARDYRLGLTLPNNKPEHFTMTEMGLSPDAVQTVAAARQAQRSPRHILLWWRPVRVPLAVKTDQKRLETFIAGHARVVTSPPQNARLAIEAGKATIIPEVLGTQYGFTNAPEAIITAVSMWRAIPLYMGEFALEPAVSARSLFDTQVKLQAILAQRIVFTIGGEKVEASPADLGSLLTVGGASAEEIAVNPQAVQDYVRRVADVHSHDARSQVLSDVTGEVLLAGQNGIRVGDTSAAAQSLAAQLLASKGAAYTLPVTQTAFKTVKAPTGGKWIEVDIVTKRMYAYNQGELVRTFLISSGASATPTVTGRFTIYSKYRSQNMSGANADGSSYFQPAVPYVNYFFQDYAIHGNYWRPASYFGNVNSSHGCVGVQVDDSAWIYNWAPIGTPVIVHT
jgi:lipoprotein-anchoring transpeptidase ErfK/SrfK